MLLVYTHKITPRVNYIFKHFFVRILQIPVVFTTKVDEFVAHNGPKITYCKSPLGSEFFIRSHDLLFEQGINDIDINILNWDDVPCFFPAGEASSIPFDIFAASFYLISRYEEYLPHVQDIHERFPVEESIAFKNNFLEQPLVDIWAYKFLELLKEKFPTYNYKKRTFKLISTIDVDTAFAYKHKGVVRSLGGYLLDIVGFKFVNFWHRLSAHLNLRKDPYDTFSELLKFKKEHNITTLFFFLIGDYTTFDKNISFNNSKFKSLIKSVADYAKIGLHPSYFAFKNIEKLKKEKLRLENITNTPIVFSRQHYLRLSIPETYQNLIDLDILEDYTMGYAKRVGFRASTCTPFYFYDLDFEIKTPLKIIPFAFMDVTLKDYMELSNKESLEEILKLKEEVQKVNGTFVSLFHNETLSENERWQGWTSIYKQMLS
ncbi:polysaccharide deacetylase family protein [Lutibacter sp. A64]|uniref:polysaccharide deacetylase family protein n=1 Tax=Lutibacter sp. A64 TaxID=2918526 RepID=UPI001F064A5E|nr:polysaccharide deacetylase family protein [Lutibacter sp. A64]UMB55263.1 polysaccharide deacetylase family protein [Lutibacter sp. A64]